MAKTVSSGKSNKNLSKKQIREIEARAQAKARKRMLVESKRNALENSRYMRQGYYEDYSDGGSNQSNNGGSEGILDNRILADIQNMKFCRKPIGFIMSLIFLIAIALIVIQFIKIDALPEISQYTALYVEAEATAEEDAKDTDADAENTENTENIQAANPSAAQILMADETTTDGEGEEVAEGEEEEETVDNNVYYSMSDPLYGWISFIAGKMGLSFDIGEHAWYSAQISKVENGMTDKFAPILIMAFPAAIILYAIFALVLFIETFICWASGDRRIYRHTGILCFIMILLSAIVLLGGFATTVEINGAFGFGGIVDYLIGLFTGVGGFVAGYGMLAMVGLPFIGLILSFFLLTKKLRSRDVVSPVIVYEYKNR